MLRTGALTNVRALHHCSTSRGLAESNLIYNRILLHYRATAHAEATAARVVIFDNRLGACGARRLHVQLSVVVFAERSRRQRTIMNPSSLVGELWYLKCN